VPLTTTIAEAWPAKVGDPCGQFFGTALRAARPDLSPTAHVLEIGCCEYDFLTPATRAWPEMTFTGVDWRRYTKQPRATVIQGDIMAQTFAPGSFDWIVSISAVEHIGLGHYAHDPVAADGDVLTLAQCWEWLAPGGYLAFDVPYNPARYEVVGTSHRVYDDAAVLARLQQGRPWREVWRGVVGKSHTSTVIERPVPLKGGESFYYIGFWWQKPRAE
jgi:hypothetical protein